MPFICNCGEHFEKSYRIFKSERGSQCKNCGIKRIKKARKLTFEDIASFIKKNGYEPGFNKNWFEKNYKDVHTNMRFICECGRTFYRSLYCFKYRKSKKCNSKCDGRNHLEQEKEYEFKQKICEERKQKKHEKNLLEIKEKELFVSTRGRAIKTLKELILESGSVKNLKSIAPELYIFLTKENNKRLIECLDEIYGDKYNYIHVFDLEKAPGCYWNEDRALLYMKETYQQNGYIKFSRPHSFAKFLLKKGRGYYLKKLGLREEDVTYYRPVGYWNDINNFTKEMIPFIKKNNGTFPPINQIVKGIGISQKKIDELGGIYYLRKIMGFEKLEFKANDGHYLRSSLEVIVDNILFFNKVPHDVDKVISEEKDDKNYRYDFFAYKHGYYIEVWGMEDASESYRKKKEKKIQFYKDKGLKLIEINARDFKREDLMIDIITEKLKPILEKPVEYTQEDEDRIIPPQKINFDNLIKELTPYMPFPNCMPSYVTLRREDRHDLVGFIVKKGGVNKVAKRLGLKTKGDYYFDRNKKEQVAEELNKLNKKLGFIPTLTNLKKIHPWLYQSLGKVGGYNKILSELSLKKEIDCLKNNKRSSVYEDMFKNPLSQKNNVIVNNKKNKRKAVIQLTVNGEIVKEYDCCNSVKGIGNPEYIRKVCKGGYSNSYSYKGFLWFYKKEYEEIKETKLKEIIIKCQQAKKVRNLNPIIQLSEEGKRVNEYSSLREIVETDFNKKVISRVCKGAYVNGHKYKGFYWYYKNEYEQTLKVNQETAI